MRKLFSRHWFILCLLAGIVVGVQWPAETDAATVWIMPEWVVVAALFLMAWTMPGRRLTEEVARPWAALWAGVISYGFLPAAAWLGGGWLLTDFQVGALVTVSGPCTLASAVLWTRLAGGNEATALLATVISTASSWLVTTAWLTGTTGAAVHLDPLDMMRELLVFLVLPVGVGQLCRLWPPLLYVATQHRFALGIVSQLLILAVLFRAAGKVGLRLAPGALGVTTTDLFTAAVFCMGLHLAALAAGWWSSPWLGFDRPRQAAVAFACSQKTLPVALLVFDRYFEATYPLAVVAILFYHAGQLLCDTPIAEMLGRRAQAGQRQE